MKDTASFIEKDMRLIWTDNFYCQLCLRPASEMHHNLGRGYRYGYIGTNRKLFSSPFNSLPVCRDCHTNIHKENPRRFLFKARVQIAKSGYEVNDNDRKFIEKFSSVYYE